MPDAKEVADCEERGHDATEKIDFHHPYTPYDIQETFMSTVYQVLEEGKIGIRKDNNNFSNPFPCNREHVFTHHVSPEHILEHSSVLHLFTSKPPV